MVVGVHPIASTLEIVAQTHVAFVEPVREVVLLVAGEIQTVA